MAHLERIAAFVADSPRGAIAPAALDAAKLALVDLLGVCVAGSVESVSGIVARHVERSSRGAATVVGATFRAAAADAALANAATGHALDFDDSSFVLGGHPSVTMLPALLAVAEEQGASGKAVLEAYVVGYEVMMKLSRAVNFEHYEKGWHPTATMGVFGTAAAVSHLLGLQAGAVQNALALAASMASGLKANFGAMSKAFQVGQASRNGVVCAQLAADGLTASAAALEGQQGFLMAYNGEGKFRAEGLSDFGGTLEILDPGLAFKKYPCCGATHAPIDAALQMVREMPVAAGEVESITIAINRRRLPHVNRPVVTTGLEAKFSLHYTVAAALTDGAISLRHFGDASIARADLKAMTERVQAVGVDRGESLSQACELTVRLKDGRTHSVSREDADGRAAVDYPAYMEPKFIDCVEQVFDRAFALELLPQLTSFEQCADVAQVMRKLGRSGSGGTN